MKSKGKEKKVAEHNEDSKIKRIVVIIISIWVIVLMLVMFNHFFVNDYTVTVNGEKINTTKIELKMSPDYKYFDNKPKDFIAVIINDFRHNSIEVKDVLECENDNYSYCSKIMFDNDDELYVLGFDEDNFERLVFTGLDFKYAGKVLGTISRLYIKNLNAKQFEDEINRTFLSYENLKRDNGLSYVFSHMKFDWSRDGYTYSLTFSVTKFANQEKYSETDKYKKNYREAIEYTVIEDVKSKLKDNYTFDSSYMSEDTELVDIKIKYKKDNLTKYTCASDAQYMTEEFVQSKSLGSLQYECVNNNGTIFFVKIKNINAITIEDIKSNTEYYDLNYIKLNTTLEDLKNADIIDFKNSCATYNYKDVLRTPNNYIDKRAYWYGQVLQVIDNSTYFSVYRVGVSCTKYQYIGGYSCPDAIYVIYSGEGNFIEDDMIKMYGLMNGTQTYTTIMGARLTIPKFTAMYIDLQ